MPVFEKKFLYHLFPFSFFKKILYQDCINKQEKSNRVDNYILKLFCFVLYYKIIPFRVGSMSVISRALMIFFLCLVISLEILSDNLQFSSVENFHMLVKAKLSLRAFCMIDFIVLFFCVESFWDRYGGNLFVKNIIVY